MERSKSGLMKFTIQVIYQLWHILKVILIGTTSISLCLSVPLYGKSRGYSSEGAIVPLNSLDMSTYNSGGELLNCLRDGATPYSSWRWAR